MARSLLVAPAAEDVGLARTCLGLLRALDRSGVHVDYVKPVAQPRADGTPDRSAALVAAVSTLRPPEPLSTAELERQLGEGGLDVVLEKIVAAWAPIYNRSDVVVVEGLSSGPSKLYASALNQALARALDADVLLVGNWPAEPDGVEGLAEQFAIAASGYTSGDTARVVGCVVHGLPAARPSLVLKTLPPAAGPETAALRTALARHQLQLIAAVPHRPELTWLRVGDLVRELNPEILHEGDLSRRIKDVAVFAQGIPGGIRVLDDGRLIVVPGDRHEVIMAACLAALNGTRLAALLLSAGIRPDPQIWQLTRAAFTGMPVLLVETDSYQTATRVRDLDPGLPARRRGPGRGRDQHHRRCAERVLAAVPGQPRPAPSAHPRRLPLPGGGASPSRRCAHRPARRDRTPYAARRGRVRRPRHRPLPAARRRPTRWPRRPGASDCGCPTTSAFWTRGPSPERYVAPLAELRRHKGWTEEVAREHLADPVTVGTMMLKLGEVDGLVSGAVHTTANTVRPALQILGTKPGTRLVSSVFFMCLPDGVVIYGDCAINPQPDAEALAEIAISSAASARAFGIEPRVAMISFSTGTSAAGTDVDKVAEATRIVREREPGLAVDGPLQYDAAAIASVGQAKRPGSPVAGRASVFIFPDLDTGNTTYKAVQRSAQVVSIGPMLQGLAKPVNDLSRGALVEDIIYTIALTAIQARAS